MSVDPSHVPEDDGKCPEAIELGNLTMSSNVENHRQEEFKKALELKTALVQQHSEMDRKRAQILTMFNNAREKEERGMKERREEMISALDQQHKKREENLKETEDKLDSIMSDLRGDLQGKDSSSGSKSTYTEVLDKLQKQVKAIKLNEEIVRMPVETLLTFGDANFKEYLQPDSLLESIISRPNIQHFQTADIQLTSKSDCWITGTCVFRNGDIAAVDRQNRLLIYFSSENDYNTPLHYDLYNKPYDITVSGEGRVAVTFPWAWSILFFDLGSEKIRQDNRKISVGHACYGLASSMNILIVSCCEHFFSSQNMFHVYENEVVKQVIKCDRLGRPLHISDGYFDFCPLSEQILFFNGGDYTEMSLSGDIKDVNHLSWRSGSAVAAIGIYRLQTVSLAPFSRKRMCLAKKATTIEYELLDDSFAVVNSALSVSADPVSRILVVSEENSRLVRGCTPNYIHFFKF